MFTAEKTVLCTHQANDGFLTSCTGALGYRHYALLGHVRIQVTQHVVQGSRCTCTLKYHNGKQCTIYSWLCWVISITEWTTIITFAAVLQIFTQDLHLVNRMLTVDW